MKFEFNWPSGFWFLGKLYLNMLMVLQYERPLLKG